MTVAGPGPGSWNRGSVLTEMRTWRRERNVVFLSWRGRDRVGVFSYENWGDEVHGIWGYQRRVWSGEYIGRSPSSAWDQTQGYPRLEKHPRNELHTKAQEALALRVTE